MSKYDIIQEVDVKKFNPFHDSLGRFSSSNGFKSYSANPNTKAGAMAIARSSAAGHGNTRNVHRESYGENIRQNANWIGRGKQQTPNQQGSVTLRYRVEPVSGLQGASATGAAWQQQNQQQGRNTKPGKQQNQQNQTQQPKQIPAPQKKPKQTQQTESDRKVVEGRDLVAEKGKAAVKNMTIDEVIKEQGFDNKPQLVKTEAEFAEAVKNGRNIGVRSWTADSDAIMAAYDDQLKNGDFYTKCEGGNALGRGMYVAVSTAAPDSWAPVDKISYESAKSASDPYGQWHVNMTIDPSAKLISISDAESMAEKDGFSSTGWSTKDSVNRDIGAYVAAKGYDGIIMDGWGENAKTGTLADNPGLNGEYLNMVNRSKVIIYDGGSGRNSKSDLRYTSKMCDSNGDIVINDN